MEKKWRQVSLYEVAKYVNGRPTKPGELRQDGVPVIKIAELNRGITQATDVISPDAVREEHWLKAGDLLFAWSGSIGVYIWHGPRAALNQHIFRVTAKPGFDQGYLRYLLESELSTFAGYVDDKKTTMGHVTIGDLRRTYVRVPPLPEQRAIAHILGTLDDKIELNRQMSETLEGMAQALFKAWFVDFEPVRAKMEGRWRRGESLPGLPAELYDLFPERLVDSELGEIPEGWRVGAFGSIAAQRCERVRSHRAVVLSAVSEGRLVPSDEHFSKRVYSAEISKYLLVERWDFAYNPSRINIGSIGMLEEEEAGGVSPVYVVVRPLPQYRWFLRFSLALPRVRAWVNALSSGSVRQSLSYEDFASIPSVIPAESIVQVFNSAWLDFRAAVRMGGAASNTLAALRDALLTKLISGELRVRDAERFIDG